MQSFVDRIELYPERRKDGNWIKNILFNFSIPVVREDEELARIGGISLENSTLSNVDLPLGKLPTHETVALLSKLSEAKHHIEVKMDTDELDLTSAEAKAMYKKIQEWVQEKYGVHVTNLNITQVKQKHGIIERENYNKLKSPDSKQPGCPSESPISEADLNATNDMPPTKGMGRYVYEEKVKAIEDAMRHFQMI